MKTMLQQFFHLILFNKNMQKLYNKSLRKDKLKKSHSKAIQIVQIRKGKEVYKLVEVQVDIFNESYQGYVFFLYLYFILYSIVQIQILIPLIAIQILYQKMFLNIQKIGKAKHKFKAKITFIKFSNPATEKGVCFKIKIERGAHDVQAISQPCRKGISKFTSDEYIIPMTMFCDDGAKVIKYLQKEAKIKVYQSDEKGTEGRRIGTKQIDLSQYANKGKLKLQIQLDPEKKTDTPVLTLEIFLERQDDDSKSVQTYSNNNDARNQADLQENRKNVKDKYKKNGKQNNDAEDPAPSIKLNLLEPSMTTKTRPKQYSLGDEKQPVKKSKTLLNLNIKKSNEEKRKLSQDLQASGQLSPNSKTPFPKGVNMAQKKRSISDQFQISTNNEKLKDVIQDVKQKQWNYQSKQSIQQQLYQKQASPSNDKNQIQTEFKNGQSPQLQAFLLKKALKEKQAEIVNLKRQNQNYKKTINKLVQQSSAAKENQKKIGYERDLQEIKRSMVSKDIEIDKLSTANKTLSSREQQYEKTIIKLRQQVIMSKQKISDMKYRQAFLVQQLFQTANKEALEQACRFLSV